MKVLMITQKVDLDDSLLGFTHTWVVKLAERVDRLHGLALSGEGRRSLPANATFHSMGKERGTKRLGRLVNFTRVVAPLVLGRQVDVVFAHMCPLYAIAAAPYCKLRHVPLVLWFTHGGVNWRLRLAEKLVDRVVTASAESFRLSSPKVIPIGHGIDTERFRPVMRDGPNSPLVILSVGRISPIKDYDTLIEAAHWLINDLGRRDVVFQIVGDVGTPDQQAYLEHLKRRVNDLGLSEHVHFVGGVPYGQVARWYQQCDVFVNLSHTGSLDKAVLEAMACGIPVLTCNEAFVPVLDGLVTQLIFAKGNSVELADKLVVLLSQPSNEREALEQRLRSIVLRDHSLDQLIERILHIFDAVSTIQTHSESVW